MLKITIESEMKVENLPRKSLKEITANDKLDSEQCKRREYIYIYIYKKMSLHIKKTAKF
jgi:hypothetical protein